MMAFSKTWLLLARSIALTLCLAATTSGQQATYTNPVYPRDFPDPFVIRHNGKYYAYATHTRGTGFQLMESPNLVEWTPRRLEFPVPWSRDHYWAPEVVEHNGTFYMTYSALDPETRKHHIAVATANTPTGPFEHRAILVRGDDNRVGVIDATIHFEDGTAYLIYSEEDPRRIVLRRMRDDLLAVEGDPVELMRPDREWEHGVTEAPTLVVRNGLYHLFYSGGPFQGRKDGPGYGVGHAVAKQLTGPYVKDDEPLLSTVAGSVYGPGHQCVFRLDNDEWWVAYHGWDAEEQPRYGSNPRGRTMRIDRLVWEGDQPKIVGPTLTPQPAPKLPEAKDAKPSP